MTTELLERAVIRMFDDDGVVYERVDDDCVEMMMPTEDSLIRMHILDHEIEPPMLTIRMVDFVRFPEERRGDALDICNTLNHRGIGKFVIDKYGDISYRLDFPTPDSVGPDEFRHAMMLAVSWFVKMYPVVMKARWAGAEVEDELDRMQNEDAPDAPDMTDDEFSNLRDLLSWDEDDDEK